jgi:hypothetical protein
MPSLRSTAATRTTANPPLPPLSSRFNPTPQPSPPRSSHPRLSRR